MSRRGLWSVPWRVGFSFALIASLSMAQSGIPARGWEPLLKSDVVETRVQALKALGQTGPGAAAAIQLIADHVDDPADRAAQAAATALVQLLPESQDALCDALDSASTREQHDRFLQAAASSARWTAMSTPEAWRQWDERLRRRLRTEGPEQLTEALLLRESVESEGAFDLALDAALALESKETWSVFVALVDFRAKPADGLDRLVQRAFSSRHAEVVVQALARGHGMDLGVESRHLLAFLSHPRASVREGVIQTRVLSEATWREQMIDAETDVAVALLRNPPPSVVDVPWTMVRPHLAWFRHDNRVRLLSRCGDWGAKLLWEEFRDSVRDRPSNSWERRPLARAVADGRVELGPEQIDELLGSDEEFIKLYSHWTWHPVDQEEGVTLPPHFERSLRRRTQSTNERSADLARSMLARIRPRPDDLLSDWITGTLPSRGRKTSSVLHKISPEEFLPHLDLLEALTAQGAAHVGHCWARLASVDETAAERLAQLLDEHGASLDAALEASGVHEGLGRSETIPPLLADALWQWSARVEYGWAIHGVSDILWLAVRATQSSDPRLMELAPPEYWGVDRLSELDARRLLEMDECPPEFANRLLTQPQGYVWIEPLLRQGAGSGLKIGLELLIHHTGVGRISMAHGIGRFDWAALHPGILAGLASQEHEVRILALKAVDRIIERMHFPIPRRISRPEMQWGQWFAEHSSPKTFPWLAEVTDALADPIPEVRAAAVETLSAYGCAARGSVRELLDLSSELALRDAIQRAMVHIGTDSIPLLRDAGGDFAADCIEAIEHATWPELCSRVANVVGPPWAPEVERRLGRLHDDPDRLFSEFLMQWRLDLYERLNETWRESLSPEITRFLMELVANPSIDLRRRTIAAFYLGLNPSDEAFETLRELLTRMREDSASGLRGAAALAIARHGPRGVAEVIPLLDLPRSHDVESALSLAGQMALPEVRRLLLHGTPQRASQAARIAGNMLTLALQKEANAWSRAADDAWNLLAQGLNRSEPKVALEVVNALERSAHHRRSLPDFSAHIHEGTSPGLLSFWLRELASETAILAGVRRLLELPLDRAQWRAIAFAFNQRSDLTPRCLDVWESLHRKAENRAPRLPAFPASIELVTLVLDPSSMRASAARRGVGELGAELISVLEECSSHGDPLVRLAAARCWCDLVRSQTGPIPASVIRFLSDTHAAVRMQAFDACSRDPRALRRGLAEAASLPARVRLAELVAFATPFDRSLFDETAGDPELHLAAMRSLAMAERSRNHRELAVHWFLQSPPSTQRALLPCMPSQGRIPSPDGGALLRPLLSDVDPVVVEHACRLTRQLDPPPASLIPTLLELSLTRSGPVRREAESALSSWASHCTNTLLKIIVDGPAVERYLALRWLRSDNLTSDHWSLLGSLAETNDDVLRWFAKHGRGLSLLMERATHGDPSPRTLALESLRPWLADDPAVQARFAIATRSPDTVERATAIRSICLQRPFPKEWAPHLETWLTDADHEVVAWAAHALPVDHADGADPNLARIRELWAHPSPRVRSVAITKVRRLPSPPKECWDALWPLLLDEDREVRQRASLFLRFLGNRDDWSPGRNNDARLPQLPPDALAIPERWPQIVSLLEQYGDHGRAWLEHVSFPFDHPDQEIRLAALKAWELLDQPVVGCELAVRRGLKDESRRIRELALDLSHRSLDRETANTLMTIVQQSSVATERRRALAALKRRLPREPELFDRLIALVACPSTYAPNPPATELVRISADAEELRSSLNVVARQPDAFHLAEFEFYVR